MIVRALSVRPLWFLGYPDQSLSRIQATVTLARSLKHPISIVFAVALAENIHLLRGEAAEAVFLGDEMIAVCREYGLAQEVEWGRCYQALAFADLGRVEEGVAQLRDSLAVQERMYAGLLAADVPRAPRRGAAQGRSAEEGLRAVRDGFEASERGLERFYLAELHRLRGELLRLTGDPTIPSAASWRRSTSRGRRGRNRWSCGPPWASRACCNAQRAPPRRARCLRAIYDWFTEGHRTRDLIEARRCWRRSGRVLRGSTPCSFRTDRVFCPLPQRLHRSHALPARQRADGPDPQSPIALELRLLEPLVGVGWCGKAGARRRSSRRPRVHHRRA